MAVYMTAIFMGGKWTIIFELPAAKICLLAVQRDAKIE